MSRVSPRMVVDRIRTVGDQHRDFSIVRADIQDQYGIDDELAETLLDLGLPARRAGGGLLFDPLDLTNVATALELNCPERILLKRWRRLLGAGLQQQRGAYRIQLTWRCPAPGHAGACQFGVGSLAAATVRSDSPELHAGGPLAVRAEPLNHAHDFGSALDEVIAVARGLTFHRIPDVLADDLGYAADTGLADCRLATRYLLKVAEDADLTVRPGAGLFVGVPMPARHVWLEVLVDGRWIAADPFFLNTLTSWGLIESSEWPLNRSPRNVLVRLATLPTASGPLILHNGETVSVQIVAGWVDTSVPRPETAVRGHNRSGDESRAI